VVDRNSGISRLWRQCSEIGLDHIQNDETRNHVKTINQTLVVVIMTIILYNLMYFLFDPELFWQPMAINGLSIVGHFSCFFWSHRGDYRRASLHFTVTGQAQIVALTYYLSVSSGVNIWLVTVGVTIFLFLPRKDKLLIFFLPTSSFVLYIWTELSFTESPIQQALAPWLMTSFFVCNLGCAIFVGSLVAYFFQTALFKTQLELIAANREVEQANATKDKFFSIIAHDLRGPIGSLSVMFNEVFEKAADIDDVFFQSVANTTKNSHQLLENLLTWARSQKGELEYNPSDFPTSTLISHNINLYKGPALQKEITLRQNNPDLWVHCDPEMASTVIRNLLNNAIKFTSKGGEVQITAAQDEQQVRVEIKDDGVGISPAIQASLFQLEQKGHSSLGTNSEAGSGLGLILCAEFVKRCGGQIGVTSELNQGSCFWFTLPSGKAPLSPPQIQPQSFLSGMRVLLVDDQSLHTQSSSAVLNELGLVFETASNGAEAVQRSQESHFDLVLMDIDMPVMNGVDANLAIHKQAQGKAPLIVALTSYSKLELNDLALEAPFDGYLNKPLSKAELLACLQPHFPRG